MPVPGGPVGLVRDSDNLVAERHLPARWRHLPTMNARRAEMSRGRSSARASTRVEHTRAMIARPRLIPNRTTAPEFEAFFREQYPMLVRMLYLLTGSNAEAEDLARGALARAPPGPG